MKKGISIKKGLIICEIFSCLFLCSCGNDKFTLPELTPDKLETLHQQETDELGIVGDVPTNYERGLADVQAYLSSFPQELEEIRAEGKVVYMSNNAFENVPEWERFLNSVKEGKTTSVVVMQNTDEGDPILYYIHYDGIDFQVVMDTHRDHFGTPDYVWERYRYMSEIQLEGTIGYQVILADEKFATEEDVNAYFGKYAESQMHVTTEEEYQTEPIPLIISTVWEKYTNSMVKEKITIRER